MMSTEHEIEDGEKVFSAYQKGTIQHQQQPAGGRDLATYERIMLFERDELHDKMVIDLGAGPEVKFAKQLSDFSIRATVFSISPDFTDSRHAIRARQLFPDGILIAATGQALPFANESFDRIFALNVLEHLHGWGGRIFIGCITEAARVLKRGGMATFGPIPNPDGPYISFLERNEEAMAILAKHRVVLTEQPIPKERLFGDSMKVYLDSNDNFGERIYNFLYHNLVLVKH